MTETHQPRTGETYTTTQVKDTNTERQYEVEGDVHSKTINGLLTIHVNDGEFDGYDWSGTTLTDDELQEVLDLFANDF